MKNWRFQFYMELYLYKTPNKNTFEEVDMKIPNYIVGFFFLFFFFSICVHINTTVGVLTKGLYLLTTVKLTKKKKNPKIALLFHNSGNRREPYNSSTNSSTPNKKLCTTATCFHVLTLQ